MEFALVLVGFGHVARRFVALLDEIGPRLRFRSRVVGIVTARHGAMCSATGVDARRAAARVEAGGTLDEATADTAAILADVGRTCAGDAASGRLVCVETTTLNVADGQPAIDHVRRALEIGAHVVCANKGPVAFAYADLAARARAAGRTWRFEGTVMDGVPVFNLVRDSMPGVRVLGFRGVLNSTTNHIITALEQGDDFATALARMQAQGIAEADASLDVDGWDAAAKTAALMNVLMGAAVTPHDIARTGIAGLEGVAVRDAVARGRRVRLVASATRREGHLEGHVAPVELPADDVLATLRGTQNALELQTDVLGGVVLVQKTADLTQTAYALVSDLASIARESG